MASMLTELERRDRRPAPALPSGRLEHVVWLHGWGWAMVVARDWAKVGAHCRVTASHGLRGPQGQRWLVQVRRG